MPSIKDWISAMRLRTLPLAAATVLAGASSALEYNSLDWKLFILILVTTFFLQILSNLANDLGDAIKGTDDDNRLGPTRSIQSGAISKNQMKKMVYVFVGLSLLTGVASLLLAFKDISLSSILFLIIGIAAIGAALNYTLGKNPYGYSGMGDLFVFIFFGIVGVVGTDFLLSGSFHWFSLLPAFSVGVFSSAVLNLNNLRDHENDKIHNKITLVVKLGFKKAKLFHFLLIISGWVALIAFIIVNSVQNSWIIVAILALFIRHLFKVSSTENPKDLDPELKKVALGTFVVFLILFIIQLNSNYELF